MHVHHTQKFSLPKENDLVWIFLTPFYNEKWLVILTMGLKVQFREACFDQLQLRFFDWRFFSSKSKPWLLLHLRCNRMNSPGLHKFIALFSPFWTPFCTMYTQYINYKPMLLFQACTLRRSRQLDFWIDWARSCFERWLGGLCS